MLFTFKNEEAETLQKIRFKTWVFFILKMDMKIYSYAQKLNKYLSCDFFPKNQN